jgi:predicted transcriptional regulator
MKVKTIKINLKALEDVGAEAIDVMRSIESGNKVTPKPHEIVFTDFTALRSFLTPKRLELIRLIRKHAPGSIAQLARLAKRDFARVHHDLQVLSQAGIVDMPKRSKGEKTKPAVAEEIRLEVVV